MEIEARRTIEYTLRVWGAPTKSYHGAQDSTSGERSAEDGTKEVVNFRIIKFYLCTKINVSQESSQQFLWLILYYPRVKKTILELVNTYAIFWFLCTDMGYTCGFALMEKN